MDFPYRESFGMKFTFILKDQGSTADAKMESTYK
jgi:hypothetical protein